MTSSDDLLAARPDIELSARDFGVDSDMKVPAFSTRSEYVPESDDSYRFDPDTTLAILAGFRHNRRVMVQGYHGTGKSTHIEQVAARLNWPLIRINLDGHVSRIDLVGRDAIVLRDGQQVTEFREGLLPWALQRPIALVFDEYDAGRPGRDVRDPARARGERQADAARPEPRDQPAPVLPAVRHHQHHRPRRHQRPLPRHAADQPGPDGPLVDRHHAELPASTMPRPRSCWPSRLPTTPRPGAARSWRWSAWPT